MEKNYRNRAIRRWWRRLLKRLRGQTTRKSRKVLPPREPKVFTYLYNHEHRVVPLTRIDEKTVEVTLPNPLKGDALERYTIPYDHRDQRVLLVFDGHVLWQGVPRSTSLVTSQVLGEVRRTKFEVRKDRDFEEPLPAALCRDEEGSITTKMVRHVLLARAGALCLRRYMDENLSAQYVLADVMISDHGAEVIWRTSSR